MSVVWDFRNRVLREEAEAKARAALAIQDAAKGKSLVSENDKFQLILSALDSDLKRVSGLPQGEARTTLKRDELIPLYMKHVQAYMEGTEKYKNPVLVQVMIWLFDIGDIDTALKLAAVAIEQNQPMPERFNRDLKTFIADAVLDWVRVQKASRGAIEPYFSAIYAEVLNWATHDVIKAQYHAIAAEELSEENPEAALEKYREALKLNPKLKVKTAMDKLEKLLKK